MPFAVRRQLRQTIYAAARQHMSHNITLMLLLLLLPQTSTRGSNLAPQLPSSLPSLPTFPFVLLNNTPNNNSLSLSLSLSKIPYKHTLLATNSIIINKATTPTPIYYYFVGLGWVG